MSESRTYMCPCMYPGPEPCNGCPDGCKRRPAGVTGWDHIDNARPVVRQPASEPASEQDVELWHRVDGRSSFEWMLWFVGPMNSEQARWFKTEAEALAALAAARGDAA